MVESLRIAAELWSAKTSEVGTEGVIYTHVVASLFCVHATAAKASSRRSVVVLSSMRNLRFVSQHRLNHV